MSLGAISLRSRLIVVILPPLLILSSVMGLWRFYTAQGTAEELSDRALLTAAVAVSRDVAVSGGDAMSYPTLDLIKEATQGDLFYHVVGPDGAFVTGFATPPVVPTPLRGADAPVYYDAIYRGEEVRAVRLRERVQVENLSGFSVVTVWQPLAQRQALTRMLAFRYVSLILWLLFMVTAVVWFGIRLGLRPLDDLAAAVSRRDAGDLRPIERRLPREVQPLVGTINRLFGRLEGAIRAREVFISDAAHQLRNPVAAVLSLAEALRARPRSEDSEARIADLERSARHASRLTSQLLSYERLRSAGQTSARRIDLIEVTRPVALRVASTALQRGLEFTFEPAPGAQPVNIDPVDITEAVENLLHNAMTHGGPGLSQILVRISREGQEVVLRVADNGAGLPAQQHVAAQERFVSFGSSSGSGLGLAIVRAAAERFGASFTLQDAKPGLVAELRFPLAS